MRRTTRLPRRLAAFVVMAALVAALGVVAPTVVDRQSNTAAAATTPTLSVMGPSLVTAAELVRYYRSVDHLPYRVVNINPFTNPPTVTPVALEDLANLFISEGNRYNVRGDVAFAQSIVETAWFNFPDYGQVRPWNNNFAGIGACDSCANGWGFPSVLDGVRAQMQLLRNYADINSRTTSIPDPPLPSLWGSTPQLAADNFNFFSHKGRAPYWIKPDCGTGCMGNGNWATSTTYSNTVTTIYRQILAFYGRTIAPETIADHYAALGGGSSVLGNPTGQEQDVPGGRMRTFQFGNIYWTPGAGAYEVHGAIFLKYLSLGGPSSPLGFPVTDEAGTAAGGGSRASTFQGGAIYWSPTTGTHQVQSAIAFLYGLMGGPASFLGLPLTDEATTPGGVGRFNDFQGGSIYWSPSTGVREVHGPIDDLYQKLGGPASPLGLPTDSERAVPGGRASAFQGGDIIWSLGTGAHDVQGAIAFLYGLTGGTGGFLGLPTSGDAPTPGGAGRFTDFEGGSIYWSPSTGVRVVRGAVLDRYRALGGPGGFLGLPVTSDTPTWFGVGNYTHFQGGSIYWSPATGAHEVHGAIRNQWASMGWELGYLGYPITDELKTPDGVGRFSRFQGGTITWSPVTGITIS